MVRQNILKEETLECSRHFVQVTTWCRHPCSVVAPAKLLIPGHHQQTLEHPWLSLVILINPSHPELYMGIHSNP